MSASVDTTNFEKFQTGNPVVRRLIGRFYSTVSRYVEASPASSVLDAGCGEGESLERLSAVLPSRRVGVDLNPASVEYAGERLPGTEVIVGNIESLPFADNEFDLVICLEVLEHLSTPEVTVKELARVAGRDLILSVPHEPWFRLGSLARGKYLAGWGNHPEHVNHWNPRSFREFLSPHLEVVELTGSMPWLIARCRARQAVSVG